MNDLLKHCPVVIEIPVAWGEMDAFQHVNNIVYLRYFESARIAYFERLGYIEFRQTTGIGPILGSLQCRFKIPVTYPDQVFVGTWVSQIDADRFIIKFQIVSQKHQKVAAEGEGVIVSYDYRENKKAPLPEEVKQRIQALEATVSAKR
jgi:acyl-CoA thioester hydrolase